MSESHPAPKTVVITGAASGIGRALAEDFAPDGPTGEVFWDSNEYAFGDPAHRATPVRTATGS